MESIAKGMRRLQEDAAWFARAKELRLLHVTTTADLAGAALKLCAGQEYHADNKSLFFLFEEPHLLGNDGWYSRSQTLRKQYTAKQQGLEKEGIRLAALRPPEKRTPPIAEFTQVLQEILHGLAAPIEGVVLVLAPTRVEPGSTFAQELRSMIQSSTLSKVRWLVIERDELSARPLVDELRERALASEWLRDENEANKDLAALVGPPDQIAQSAEKPLGWQAPGAMPDVEPPPRVNAAPPLTDEQIREQGLSPEFVKGGGQALQKALLGAALALKQGNHTDAIRLQSVAVELCGKLKMLKEQVINTLVLGSYYLASQARGPARKSYEQAVGLAAQHELRDQEAQGHLALGLLDAVEGQHQNAMAHYAAAAEIAEAAQSHILALEAWRTAGQLAYNLNSHDTALQSWLRGLKLAAALEPKQAKATSAAEIARGVAAIFRARGNHSEAGTLDQQAFRYEHGLDPTAVVPQA